MSETKRGEDELGALWVKVSPKGADYMTGSVICPGCGEKHDIVVFVNAFKTKENHPSYRILKSQPKEGRFSTRRDEAHNQRPQQAALPKLVKPVPQMTRLATLGVRDEDLPGFDSSTIPQTTSRPKAKPVNGANQPDWTDDVPPVIEDEDIPF